MINALPPVALVAGPTASGKSALALALAKRSGGVIVNADASQIYRDLDVLTARPSAVEMAEAEHRLFGTRDGAEPCSAADYAALARDAVADIHASGRLPILVGGTGLYIRSLLDGIAPVPPIDPAIRRKVREANVGDNRAALLKADPDAAARLNPGDTTRMARALEVALSTGRTLAEWQDRREGGIGRAVMLSPLILLPPRDWLNRRCDERFAAMLEGAVAEVEALLARGLDPDLPVMRAIGVREIAAMFRGEMTRGQALVAGQLATRQYAKRQYTWFAHQPPLDWPRFHEPLEEAALDAALALFDGAE
ncbi:MAG TPA: tRNA (adenosine(37)-N6)-dimethylallyltransferase MiaA [Sphingomicrobium sp.]|nr:tRNA (adenosine(37)-N6)-dimethylallyltransferase MiaA [Sphingomicrobium sp.]